jgi:uncharacterized protein YndB with AHSA1/START domain
MPTVSRSRVIGARAGTVWALIADPHNLPRWWPETTRVEDVEGSPGSRQRFTQVMSTSGGRPVRADYRCTAASAGSRIVWEQRLDETPFEGFLRSAELEIRIDDGGDGTSVVTIEARRRLRGMSRLGSPMMRRATGRTLEHALDGIERTIPDENGGWP